MRVGPKKVFESDLNPKYSPVEPKKGKKAPKGPKLKMKRKGFTYKSKVVSLYE